MATRHQEGEETSAAWAAFCCRGILRVNSLGGQGHGRHDLEAQFAGTTGLGGARGAGLDAEGVAARAQRAQRDVDRVGEAVAGLGALRRVGPRRCGPLPDRARRVTIVTSSTSRTRRGADVDHLGVGAERLVAMEDPRRRRRPAAERAHERSSRLADGTRRARVPLTMSGVIARPRTERSGTTRSQITEPEVPRPVSRAATWS